MPVLQINGKAFDSKQKRPGSGAENMMRYFVWVDFVGIPKLF